MPRAPAGRRGVGAPRALFVDSGAWIALFSADDDRHGDAEAALRVAIAARTRLLTSNLVVAEVHRLLLHRAGIRAAATAVARMEESASLTIVFAARADHERGRWWLARLDDQRITYTDAVSFAVMEAHRCTTAMTFDHDFALAGFRLF